MRYVHGLVCVCAFLVAMPLSASAQDSEEDGSWLERWHPEAFEDPAKPSSEPAPEEPSLQLKVDDAGVDVVRTPPPTADGYPATVDGTTVEELEVRVRRAKFGLIAPAAVTAAGVVVFALGTYGDCYEPKAYPDPCDKPRWAGGTLAIAGSVGLIATSILVGVRKQELRRAVEDYTPVEPEVRVRRAKIGLGVSGGVIVSGVVALAYGAANPSQFCLFGSCTPIASPSLWAGTALLAGGLIGLVTSGALLGARKRKARELQQAHYGTPRRVQWDVVRSRMVF